MSDFNTAVNIVLKNEGGYFYNPKTGEEANYGISKASHPYKDIRNLTEKQARQIYFGDYWIANQLNLINNQKIANFALDTVVNHGQGPRLLQKAANQSGASIAEDNKIGSKTIAALNSVNPNTFIARAIKTRKNYYLELIKRNPYLAIYKNGWFKRVNSFNAKNKYIGIFIMACAMLGIYYVNRKK